MPARSYDRPEHEAIAGLLRRLHTDFILVCECWFGGGTAIVMKNGEYRLSRDVDFLCSSRSGHAKMRAASVSRGAAGLFDDPVAKVRDFGCHRYGLRGVLAIEGQRVKLGIVSEGRIDLAGAIDPSFGCPTLSRIDQFAEKLLANRDRGLDPGTAHRDVIDRGMLTIANGGKIPAEAVGKASKACFDVIESGLKVGRSLLERPYSLGAAATALQMDRALTQQAIETALAGVEPWISGLT